MLLPAAFTEARAQLDDGTYAFAGPAFLPGAGVAAGSVVVGRFVTREVWLSGSYRSSASGSVRAIGTVGGAIRLLGARRTVLQLPVGVYDIDLGMRLGPSILFRFEETAIDKHKRFTLVAEPFLRVIADRGTPFSLEVGIHRPAVRGAVWFRF